MLLTNVPLLIGQVAVKVWNRGKALYVDVNIVAAEQSCDLATDVALKLRLSIIAVLCLTRLDHTSAILRESFQILIGKENDPGLENCKQQRAKHRGNQSEFDGG